MSQQAISNPQYSATSNEHPLASTSGGTSLRIEGISKTFFSQERSVEALRPVDLTVEAGEFVCFLGPSGCGKSTLLSIIAGLETADTGQILANEKVVKGPGTDRILLFQEAALFPGSMSDTTLNSAYDRHTYRHPSAPPSAGNSSISCICKALSAAIPINFPVVCASAPLLPVRWPLIRQYS